MKSTKVLATLFAAALAVTPLLAPAQTAPSYQGIDAIMFQRSADDVFANLNKLGSPDKGLSTVDQFRYDFFAGNWPSLAATLKKMPADLAARTYDKMLTDLTAKGAPFMQLEDVLGLIRANPGDWSPSRLKQAGLVVKACVPAMQKRWLQQQLEAGIAGLGGKEPVGRINAGRLLIHAQFTEMATQFLPTAEQAKALPDATAREEILAFYQVKAEAEEVEKTQPSADLAEFVAVLADPKSPAAKVKSATAHLVRQSQRLSPATIESTFNSLVKANPSGANDLMAELLKQFRTAIKGRSLDARQANLYAVQALAKVCAAAATPDDPRWTQMLRLMADHWLQEADLTFTGKAAATKSGKFEAVDPQELVSSAPVGPWLAGLPADMVEKVDVALARSVTVAGDFDRAATLIVELSKRNPDAAFAVADDFLVVWGERNDPNIPEPLRKKFGLPEDAHVAVTPVMMQNNINNLARIMALFRQAGVQSKDNARIVSVFDAAYGNAEAYQLAHIEKVFGSVPEMSEGLVLQMMNRMAESLGGRWRNIEMQKANLTRRDESHTLEMVRNGYTAALQIADQWLAKKPNGYRVWTVAGTMMNDWADFEYFQQMVAADSAARNLAFKQKTVKAQEYFEKGAAAYAKAVPSIPPAEYTVDPYIAWFNALLGVNSNGDINLSKPMNRAALEKMRTAMRSLPGKAADAHVGNFARYVSNRMQSTTTPLHEDLKYKFLASSLVITQDNPFTLQARKQVEYYDQLLKEIRLQTRVDGSTTVGRDQDFGIVLSVVHTEAMGRMAKFSQYLSNALPAERAAAARARQPKAGTFVPKTLRMSAVQGPRDALELSLREALDPYFDIRSITFSRTDVAARPTDQPGWNETVLAYIHVRVKDSSVDRVPPVAMELNFLDLSGPVTIPTESAETVIKVAPQSQPPRPVDQVQITQTLDPRQFNSAGALTLRVRATAVGLVPELEDLIDLSPISPTAKVRSVAPHAGTLVTSINSWGEKIAAASDREWTVVLDAEKARDAGGTATFSYPTAKRADVTLINQTYDDMNLVPVKGASVTIGEAGVGAPAPRPKWVFAAIGASVLLIVGILTFVLLRLRGKQGPQAPRPRDLYRMPEHIDGFVVVRLLKGLAVNPLVGLGPDDNTAVRRDIERVQQAVFTPGAPGLSETELREIAGKWLARLN